RPAPAGRRPNSRRRALVDAHEEAPEDREPLLVSPRCRSALGVLRRLAGALQADLLAFLHAGVARQELLAAERRLQAFVGAGERTRDAVRERAGPAADTPAGDARLHVPALCAADGLQRGEHRRLMRAAREHVEVALAVHQDLAAPRVHAHARDRRLAPAGAVEIA